MAVRANAKVTTVTPAIASAMAEPGTRAERDSVLSGVSGCREVLNTTMSLQTHLTELHGLLGADRERTSDRISALTRDVTLIVEATRLTATDDEHDPGRVNDRLRALTDMLGAARGSQQTPRRNGPCLGPDCIGDYGRCERCGSRSDQSGSGSASSPHLHNLRGQIGIENGSRRL